MISIHHTVLQSGYIEHIFNIPHDVDHDPYWSYRLEDDIHGTFRGREKRDRLNMYWKVKYIS